MQTGIADWLALTTVVASIALAALTVGLMLVRLRAAPDENTSAAPSTLRDPVLLLSVVGVVLLAVAAWLLR